MKFEIDQAALDRVANEAVAKLQPEINAQVQDIVRGVRDEMTGQPADAVYDELVRRLGPNVTVNEPNLRIVADEIEAGTLAD